MEVDVEHDLLAAVAGVQVLQAQERVPVSRGRRRHGAHAVPKYASASRGEPVSSSIVPSAVSRPRSMK